MPLKQRNVVIDLGAVDAGDASPEVDLSSMTHCVLYMKPDPAVTLVTNRVIYIESCPLPLGETAADEDWYRLYGHTAFGISPATATQMQVEWTYPGVGSTPTQASPIPISGVLGGTFFGWSMSMPACPRRLRFVMPLTSAAPPGFDADNLTVEGMRSIG